MKYLARTTREGRHTPWITSNYSWRHKSIVCKVGLWSPVALDNGEIINWRVVAITEFGLFNFLQYSKTSQ